MRSNAFLHGVHAGLGFSRAVSHPFRTWYEWRYRPRHRFPRAAFLFDLALLAVIGALIILIISLKVFPPAAPSLRLTVSATPVIALQPVTFVARVAPADGKPHASVSVSWGIPNGWEVIGADPPIRADGTAYVGSIGAGESRASRLVLRPFVETGTTAIVELRVSHLVRGFPQTYTAAPSFPVLSSALTARIPEAFRADAVVQSGTVIPIVVSNGSDASIPSVELRASEPGTIIFPRTEIGDLSPYASRVIYVELGRLASSPVLAWDVLAASRVIASGSFTPHLAEWTGPVIATPIVAHAGMPTDIRIRGAANASLLVVPPASTGTVQIIPIVSDNAVISVAAPSSSVSVEDDRWLVAPIRSSASGERTLGEGAFASFVGAFPFTQDVVYTGPSGDQLGAGPNPPRAGEETRYWVFWHIGPIQSALRHVSISATLGPRVSATGNVALPNGGSSSVSGRTVSWTLPEIGTDADGNAEAAFGFEVSVLPGANDAGVSIELVGPVEASARSASSGLTLSASAPAAASGIVEAGESAPIRVE